MGFDKKQAQKHKSRISEKNLLLIAFFAGSPGIYLGMSVFRHKTRKSLFKYGVLLLLLWNSWLCWALSTNSFIFQNYLINLKDFFYSLL
jgi:uncharacterized membrane protein YsdA (DUF1294 family)